MRAETGMVFQMFNLFPHLTAAENVMLGLVKVRGKPKAEAREIAAHWLARVGLSTSSTAFPPNSRAASSSASASPARWPWIPRSCFSTRSPPRSIPSWWARFWTSCLQLAKEGMTMLVVTHEIAFSRDISDKVVFMADGVVSAEGRPAQLFAPDYPNPRLQAFLARFRAAQL